MKHNLGLLLTTFFISFSSLGWCIASETKDDSCIKCHQNMDFMVTNKKLYDYFQTWRASIHGQEEVTCVDCHGGNSKKATKKEAHGELMDASNNDSMVNFRNIPEK